MTKVADLRQWMPAAAVNLLNRRRYDELIRASEHRREKSKRVDPIDWMQERFLIPSTSRPIELMLHQKGIIRFALRRTSLGRWRWATVLYGTIKKSGKALDVSTPVCTPAGWSTMGQLREGDEVFATDGSPCRVVEAFPVMFDRPCYAVRFSDGAELIADAEHQWCVRSLDRGPGLPRGQEWVATTAQLAEHMRYGTAWNHSVAVAGVLAMPEAKLPIPPYVLGAWLGDGHAACARITCSPSDQQVIDEIRAEGVIVRPNKGINFGLAGLAPKLRTIGVLDNKHIPVLYLRASPDQRLALLQGLMDTDGSVAAGRFSGEKGRCELTLTRKPLVDGAVELIRGLGFKPSVRESRAMLNGRDCGPRWRIAFTAFAEQPVFRLKRKRLRLPARSERAMKKLRSQSRQIVSIESVPCRPVRCIAVDAPSGTFLAGREMIPTHNSTIAGAVARYVAETQTRFGEVYAVGNDYKQARDRAFKEARRSIELSPGYITGKNVLPGEWDVLENKLRCHLTGSFVEALAVDAKGEAGGHPALSIWTELWGMETEDAKRFWDEMTQDPTQPESMRWVETYAGYDGESELLYTLYKSVILNGRQLTNREFAESVCRDVDGERYEDFLFAFVKTNGDPDALVPLFVNEEGGMFGYWDSGLQARRFSWQVGELGDTYYREQEASLPPRAFRRLHHNEWTSAESSFVPIELYDACYDPALPEVEPDQYIEGIRKRGEPMILAVDAAATGDCFAIVGITRHPKDRERPAIRKVKKWSPSDFESGRIDFSVPEQFLREVCKLYNVKQICYDPYQLEDMMQRLNRERVAWCDEFSQGHARLEADRAFYDAITQGKLAHMNQPELREHILNANAKLQKDDDSKMRIIKKATDRKIDLAVAASMGCARAMYLNL